jgi:replicative DNA helicase
MRSGLKISSREQEIAEISRGLKGLAKELNIPVIALSQLSRSVESRSDKKPMLQDLRESGQIEQDADMVLFCYRPEYYNIDQYEVDGTTFDAYGLFMLIIAKHRNGELGEIPLKFIHEQTKITNHGISNDFKPNNEVNFTNNSIKPNKEFSSIDKDILDFFENQDEEEIPF